MRPFNRENCRKHLAKDYWFYLAIENSNCTDYVTEKLFKALHHLIVPISVSGTWPDSEVPSDSVVRYTGGVKELAVLLKFLMGNPGEYRRYLEWRTGRQEQRKKPDHVICQICHALYDENVLPSHKFRGDSNFLDWVDRANCYSNWTL